MKVQTSNLPEVIQKAVTQQKIDLARTNLILPTQTFGQVMGEYDKITIEVVRVDPDPKQGDVYEVARGVFALAQRPLMAMANAVSIMWDPQTTTLLESSDTKARAKATGAMKKPNGGLVGPFTEEKTVDLVVIEEEQLFKLEEEAEKGPIVKWGKTNTGKPYPIRGEWKDDRERERWIARELRRIMIQYRKFKDERSQTGAKERVIRKILALKSTFTTDELQKQFAVPQVTLNTNKMLENPFVRQSAIDKIFPNVSSIFGSQEPRTIERASGEPEALPAPSRKIVPVRIAEQEIAAPVVEVEAEESDPFQDDIPFEASMSVEDEIREVLRHYYENSDKVYHLHPEGKEIISTTLAQEKLKLEALKACLRSIEGYIKRKEKGNSKYAAHMAKMREAGKAIDPPKWGKIGGGNQ